MADERQKVLDRFKRHVISQSRRNLTRLGHRATSKLYNSIEGDVKAFPNSIQVLFTMEEYGQFVDQGVKGKTSKLKAPNSPFRFGTGTGKKGGLTKGIRKWVRVKGLRFKDKETGKTMTYDSTAYLISRSIYNKGMKPSLFFTKPFESAFKNLPDELAEAYGLEIEDLIKNIIKQP